MKLNGEGTLENPIELGAEGVRLLWAESLRQKDRDGIAFLRFHLHSSESLQKRLFIFFEGEKEK